MTAPCPCVTDTMGESKSGKTIIAVVCSKFPILSMVGHPELGNLVVSLGQRGPAEKGLRARVILALWAEVVFLHREMSWQKSP